MTLGIERHAVYVPTHRLERKEIGAGIGWFSAPARYAKGSRAFCSWDEDVATMAVEVARDCAPPFSRINISKVILASTTPPFLEPSTAAHVCAALGVADAVESIDVGGSGRCALTALRMALETSQPTLVIGAERRRAKPGSPQELSYGAGAAAFLVSPDAVGARYLGGAARTTPFIDHFRAMGVDHDYYWEERWIRDEGVRKILPATAKAALEKAGVAPNDVKRLCAPGHGGVLAKALGLSPDCVIDDEFGKIGDAGSAHALIMLSAALDQADPGDIILAAGFGSGAESLVFEAGAASAKNAAFGLSDALAQDIHQCDYTKYLSFYNEFSIDGGMRGEDDLKAAHTEQYRSAHQIMSFSGGKCQSCGAVQFPSMVRCVHCGASHSQTLVSLADEAAAVKTFTADMLQYYPSPPLYMGLVQFDNGARLLMEMVNFTRETMEVGAKLRMTHRIKSIDHARNNKSYFWKAAKARV